MAPAVRPAASVSAHPPSARGPALAGGARGGALWRTRPVTRFPFSLPEYLAARFETGHLPAVGRARCRSTKAGVRTPATPPGVPRSRTSSRIAQRRPGCEPRRHLELTELPQDLRLAQRRPGCEPRRHTGVALQVRGDPKDAQQRPGCEPRRHHGDVPERRRPEPRSTKAGVRTPATLRRKVGRGLAPVGRSTKAGVRTPATPGPSSASSSGRRPLNEGRGANPGDTLPARYESDHPHVAQRRPGCEPRRHDRGG